MGYKRPSGYRTPHEIIESTKDISKYEAVFGKNKGPFKELVDNVDLRKKNSVFLKDRNFDYNLHTHFSTKKPSKYYSTIPSINDITTSYFNYLFKGKKSANIISIIKDNKEIGRVHFNLDNLVINFEKEIANNKIFLSEKKELSTVYEKDLLKYKYLQYYLFPKLFIKHPKKRTILNIFVNKKNLFTYKIVDIKQMHLILQELGVVIKHVPMPGYVFNKEKLNFEKIK